VRRSNGRRVDTLTLGRNKQQNHDHCVIGAIATLTKNECHEKFPTKRLAL